MRKQLVAISLVLTGLIVFVTLGPVADRPQFGHPQLERFLAFFLLAGAWTLAVPGRRFMTAIALALGAALLELSQALVPHRDPGLIDAIVKMTGATFGVLMIGAMQAVSLKPTDPRT
jgi:VanZ family protein